MSFDDDDSTEISGCQQAIKRTWTPQEDQEIMRLVQMYGASNWAAISSGIKGRTGKQCRERYHNHLHPDIKKGEWTEEENRKIVELQAKYGNQWAKITKELPGRTDNAVKNRWHAAMRTQQKMASPAGKRKVTSTSLPIRGEIPPLNLAKLSAPKEMNTNKQPPAVSNKTSSKLTKSSHITEMETTSLSPSTEKIVDTRLLRSSSGNISSNLYSPTIEEIVRKYSPRFEADMKLSDNIDLNMYYHGHQTHAHSPSKSRTENLDELCDMGIRLSHTQITPGGKKLPSLAMFSSPNYDIPMSSSLIKRRNTTLCDNSGAHYQSSQAENIAEVNNVNNNSQEDYAAMYKRHKMQNLCPINGSTIAEDKSSSHLSSLEYHPSSLSIGLTSSWSEEWTTDYNEIPMFTQQLERSISDDMMLITTNPTEQNQPESADCEPEASFELFEAMEISPRTNQLLLNILECTPVVSPRPEFSPRQDAIQNTK